MYTGQRRQILDQLPGHNRQALWRNVSNELVAGIARAVDEGAAWGEMSDEQFQTQRRLLELGVEIITAHGLDAYDGSHAQLGCIYTGRSREIAADAVLLVTARNPVDELYRELTEKIDSDASGARPTVDKIGDCDAPAIIAAAVYAGHRYARDLGVDLEERDVVRQDRLFD